MTNMEIEFLGCPVHIYKHNIRALFTSLLYNEWLNMFHVGGCLLKTNLCCLKFVIMASVFIITSRNEVIVEELSGWIIRPKYAGYLPARVQPWMENVYYLQACRSPNWIIKQHIERFFSFACQRKHHLK